MKKNSPRFFKLTKPTFFLLGLLFTSLLSAQQDLDIGNETYIIQENTKEEFNNITLSKNSSILEVNGTLIVQGNLTMDGNSSQFIMGPNALVIIYGNFQAHNKVDISVSSYLIVYGDFSQKTASGKAEIDASNGNIYIFGEVDENWTNFDTCQDYEGNVTELGTEACDYGTGDNFEDNFEEFPDEFKNTLNCYDLSSISNQAVCLGDPTTFSISAIDNVTYQWQKKIGDSDWTNVGSNSNIYSTPGTTLDDNGNFYRIIVKSSPESSSKCKISISKNVILNVQEPGIWVGIIDNNWNNTANWSCNTLPTLETNVVIPETLDSGNYPEITAGNNALVKDLIIENNATIDVTENWLRIAGDITNNGLLNTETGSISFEGANAQIIPASAFANNRIQNLLINNLSGVTSSAIIEITGTLKVENGTFDTGNELTLISTVDQTALIDGSGSGEVIGLVSMQRYLDRSFGYKYFSTPFKNSVVGDFSPFMSFEDPATGFPHFYRYNENRNVSINETLKDATGWEPYIDQNNPLNVSEGYALNFGSSTAPQTIELIGEVNNGTISSRQLKNNHREYTKGFHLVGNPYPSPIDWDSAQGWTRNNIDDGIYFFTASDDNQYTGTYTAYVNDISTEDPLIDGRSSNIIPSMQGFFIKVSDSNTQDLITGSFGMDNNVRVSNFEQEFYRSQLSEQKSLIRLEAGFKSSNQKDAMVIYFSPYATPDFEKEMDAHKLMNTDPEVPSFYNITEDKKELAINAIPLPETRSYKKIPLGIKADQSGQMTINLASIENISPNFNIYLIDHLKGIGQNLSRKPEYAFNIKAGTYNSRFELMFSEKEVTNPAIAFNEPFNVEVRNGEVIVKLNLEEKQRGILHATTMTGQILQIKSGVGKDEVIFEGITSDGVYIINLQLGKTQLAKKIVIKK